MPAQGQASTLHCLFLDGATTEGAQCSNQPKSLGDHIRKQLNAAPSSPDPARPVPAMLVLRVFIPRAALQQLRSMFSPQESSQGHAGAAALAGDHLHALLCQPGGGRDLQDCLHLLQLLSGVLPGMVLSTSFHPRPLPRDVEEPILADASPRSSQNQTPANPRAAPKLLSLGVPTGHSSTVTLLLVSFQGFFVSVFYCFLNSEVSTRGWGCSGGSTLLLASRHTWVPGTWTAALPRL